MIVETVRLSKRAREQLIQLKSKTGIQQWNILSRWALCLSLADPSPPSAIAVSGEGAVEMTWKVFGGEVAEIYAGLVRQRCSDNGVGVDPKVVTEQFRLHLHRGIGMLVGNQSITSTESLLQLATLTSQIHTTSLSNSVRRPLTT